MRGESCEMQSLRKQSEPTDEMACIMMRESVCSSLFSRVMIRYSEKSYLGEKCNSRLQSIIIEKTRKELETPNHLTSKVKCRA